MPEEHDGSKALPARKSKNKPPAAEEPAPGPIGKEEPPEETAPARRPRKNLGPPPGTKFDARMSLTLSPDQKRALDLARVDDGVEGTARIRAMIALWEGDERVRRRIDLLAKSYR